MDPAGLKSQMHLKQGVSDQHSLRTNCCDNLHKGLDLHYTSDDDVDPIKLADSFLALDEYSTEKYADVSSNACRLPKPLSWSDLETEDVGCEVRKVSAHYLAQNSNGIFTDLKGIILVFGFFFLIIDIKLQFQFNY